MVVLMKMPKQSSETNEIDHYVDPPARVINIITGGDADLVAPYKIAFVVHGARKQSDYLSVVKRYNEYVEYFHRTKEQQINGITENTAQSIL